MIGWLRNIVNAVFSTAAALFVTIRYWVITYGERRRTFTEQFEYPELPLELPQRSRGFHRYDVESCIACNACARDCPAVCIYIDRKKVEGRKGFVATSFVVDYTKCLFCGICTEACPTSCIHMGSSYDLSCYSRDGCIVDFCRLPPEIATGEATLTPTAVAYSKSITQAVFNPIEETVENS
ncbi:MAG: 4Fe-4S binding protein [Pirellulales bacterium]|nr:4Fe-4S binding protein [Pirellulales bacterium]